MKLFIFVGRDGPEVNSGAMALTVQGILIISKNLFFLGPLLVVVTSSSLRKISNKTIIMISLLSSMLYGILTLHDIMR